MALLDDYSTISDRKRERIVPAVLAPDFVLPVASSFQCWSEQGHLLVRGDCLEVLRATVADNSAAMIFTDPPYGINHGRGKGLESRYKQALGKRKLALCRPIPNDGDNHALIQAAFRELARILIPGGACCCCAGGGGGGRGSVPQFARWILWLGGVLRFKQAVCWDKGRMGMGWHYHRSYELILVAEKPGAPARWYGGTNVENIIRPGQFGIRKIVPKKHQHPTEKPVELAMHFLKLHSQPGELVIDPFMGRGSTGIACHRLGRKFLGVELDSTIFEQAVERFRAELAYGGLL